MKKISWILILMLSITLTACGDETPQTEDSNNESEMTNDDLTIENDITESPEMEIDGFEMEETPEIMTEDLPIEEVEIDPPQEIEVSDEEMEEIMGANE